MKNVMKTNWSKTTGSRYDYVYVTREEVIVGHHYGSGQTDAGGACSHAEFLEGQFRGMVAERFGEAVLAEVDAAIAAAGANPHFERQREEIARLRAYLAQFPVDETIARLHEREPDERGYLNYGNAGGYKTVVHAQSSTGAGPATLTVESQAVAIEHDGATVTLTLPGHCSGAVALGDYFCLLQGGAFTVLASTGEVVFDTYEADLAREVFGSTLRLRDITRVGDAVLVYYYWFHDYDGPPGILQYRRDEGFVGRWEVPEA